MVDVVSLPPFLYVTMASIVLSPFPGIVYLILMTAL